MIPLAIILLTYERTDCAVRTVSAIKANLRYPEIAWIVADDGSRGEHLVAVRKAIGTVCTISSSRRSYGGMANWAWEVSKSISPVTLWVEDDWVLDREFDPSHYINLLISNDNIGMVRLGRLPIGLDMYSIGDGKQIYLHVLPTRQYMFSGNPSLRHIRFYEAFGAYPEGLQPDKTETDYDNQIRIKGAHPKILYPVDLGTWGLFGHIGTVRAY
jgi:hypothetical protein